MVKLLKCSFFKELNLRKVLFLALVFGLAIVFGFLINNSEGIYCCKPNKKNKNNGKTSNEKRYGENSNVNGWKEKDKNPNKKEVEEEEKNEKKMKGIKESLKKGFLEHFKNLYEKPNDIVANLEKYVTKFIDSILYCDNEGEIKIRTFEEDIAFDFKVEEGLDQEENECAKQKLAILNAIKKIFPNEVPLKKSMAIYIDSKFNIVEVGSNDIEHSIVVSRGIKHDFHSIFLSNFKGLN